jgi:hypothetical protein
VLATGKGQKEAIGWPKKNGHTPLVARVRRQAESRSLAHGLN